MGLPSIVGSEQGGYSVSVNIASPGAEAYEMAECWGCGVTDPQEDIAVHEGGHNIQNEICEECFRKGEVMP